MNKEIKELEKEYDRKMNELRLLIKQIKLRIVIIWLDDLFRSKTK